jgi:hypothetical protein
MLLTCGYFKLAFQAELSVYDKNEQIDAKTEKMELGTRLEDCQRKVKLL